MSSASSPASSPKPAAAAANADGKGKNKKKKDKRTGLVMMSYIPKVAKSIKNGTSTTPELGAATHGMLLEVIMPRLLHEINHFRTVGKSKRVGLPHVMCGFKAILNDKRHADVQAYAVDKINTFARSEKKKKSSSSKKKKKAAEEEA